MGIFTYNLSWMLYNLALAFLPVLFGIIGLRIRPWYLKVLFFLLWFFYLPNSLYVITDLIYVPKQLDMVSLIGKIGLIIQYGIFIACGLWAYLYSMHLCERFLRKKKMNSVLILIVVNFMIGFGIMMGRVLRTNSWEIFTNPLRVIHDVLYTGSSFQLMTGVLFFGITGSVIYFCAKSYMMNHFFKPLDRYVR